MHLSQKLHSKFFRQQSMQLYIVLLEVQCFSMQQCIYPFVLSNASNSSSYTCPNGTSFSNQSGTCIACNIRYQNICSTCNPTFILEGIFCTCPPGFSLTPSSICVSCNVSNCQQYDSQTLVQTAFQGLFWLETIIVVLRGKLSAILQDFVFYVMLAIAITVSWIIFVLAVIIAIYFQMELVCQETVVNASAAQYPTVKVAIKKTLAVVAKMASIYQVIIKVVFVLEGEK